MPLLDSGLRFSRIDLMVGCLPAWSSSSQCAPSKTGVATRVDGRVVGRVLRSVLDIGSSPTVLVGHVPAPTSGIAEVGFEDLPDVHS